MKRKWKQKRLAAAAAMVIVVFSAIPAVPAMAAGSYETQVPSEIQLGAVDIMLLLVLMNTLPDMRDKRKRKQEEKS